MNRELEKIKIPAQQTKHSTTKYRCQIERRSFSVYSLSRELGSLVAYVPAHFEYLFYKMRRIIDS